MGAVDAGYANSIEGKGEDCRVARLRCGARPSIAPRKEASEQESMASTVVEEACRQICLAERQRGTERAETRRVTVLGKWFHAAAVTSGGERSWISAAVSLSMTFMGPPQLGLR